MFFLYCSKDGDCVYFMVLSRDSHNVRILLLEWSKAADI